MTSQIVTTQIQTSTKSLSPIIDMVLDTVSERSQRDYGRALTDFIVWYQQSEHGALNKAAVNGHVAALKENGVPASSINQRLAAIRKLALESADNGLIDENTAQSIKRVKNIKQQGQKLGNWLSKAQAAEMINAPDVETLKGKRDRAILAVMIGCGLRREEMATLAVDDLQQREGRWVILDLEGKHGRTRTVPMASWVKSIVDQWTDAAAVAEKPITSGYLFLPMRKGGHLQDGPMTSQAIWKVVQKYKPVEKLAPHDLRRTFAKLAHTAGAPIEQIQQSLGHASIQTTEKYLGVELNLAQAPSDMISLNL